MFAKYNDTPTAIAIAIGVVTLFVGFHNRANEKVVALDEYRKAS